MKVLRAALAKFFRLLPIRATESALKVDDERATQSVPASFGAIVLNGLFYPTAARVLSPGLLLAWFVSDITSSALWVALIIPVQQGLALLPEPFYAEWLSTKPRSAPYYRAQAFLRMLVWCGLGLAAWTFGGGHANLLLALFFLVFAIDSTCGGFGNIAFNDALASVIPEGLRGRARGWRGIFGAAAGGAAGLLIRRYFSERSSVQAFGLLFIAAGSLYAVGGLVFALVDEPQKNAVLTDRPSLSRLLHRIREMLRSATFRRFVASQVLLVPLTQGLPFFTLFAKRAFNLQLKALGVLILVDAVTPIVGNFIWGRLSDSHGNRWVIIAAAAFGVIAPLCGVTLYAMQDSSSSGALVLIVLAIVVFTAGTATVGIDLAAKNYMLDLAPNAEQRPLYIGVSDTLIGIPTMLLIGVGGVIDAFGFAPVFSIIGVAAIAGTLVASRLPLSQKGAVE